MNNHQNNRTGLSDGRINVVIADDHFVVAEGVKAILNAEADINVVGVALSISDLISCMRAAPCDVLICDYSFESDEEPDGLSLFKRIKRQFPGVAIIVLTGHQDITSFVRRVMETGVTGFLRKSSEEIARLPSIIRSVKAGGKFMDAATSAEMLQSGGETVTSLEALSERELEVFRLFGRGMSVTEIAVHTNRSVKTISTQKLRAMHKLGIRSDADLFRVYVENFG